ncbi:MAG: hypothetical protein KME29_10725 [Calothrix sp. FI2-JRJ7]|jgi:hypothetical protein|nr:hypothetical protein [Calothrix sp. FI2-JRJ7]
MSNHSQQNSSPEYEINLSINLQIPIKIRPEVSLLSSTSKNEVLIKPEQTPLIQELLQSIVLPEDFQHAGAIKQIDAVVISAQHEKLENIQPSTTDKKTYRKRTFIGRAADLFNDGFALAVNITASAMFAGKVANYSWE